MSIFVSLIIFLSLIVSPVLAQETTGPKPYTREEIKSRLNEGVQQFRQNVKTERTELKTEVQNLRTINKEELEKRREELKNSAEEKREEFKNRMKEVREKAKEQIEAKRAEMKERLQTIRDEHKKKIAERLEKQLNELNERMMDHFSSVLDKLEKALVNIESRTDKAQARGWNVSAVRIMIFAAENAITEARKAVEDQSAKTYTPIISGNEEGLKPEVGQTRQTLHRDLVAVRGKVRLAYEAVRKVATTLAQVPRIDEDATPLPTASPSPTLTPTPSPTSSPTPVSTSSPQATPSPTP
ncbi:MAG: hypothetical protein G01um10142_351 [Parcubacteria group bacterium Gr01-1014_2]|nr:MAG: hypothetical protein G01um10142_351 [Parcubacteria group bacterium Gr01-1014_2]